LKEIGLSLPQDIDADDADGALGACDADVELEPRVDPGHSRQARDHGIERFGKAGARCAHLQVRLSGHRAHRCRDILHRGAVDEVNPVAERHSERDAHDRKQSPAARAAPAEDGEKLQHAD
jgi:hypothetical protein